MFQNDEGVIDVDKPKVQNVVDDENVLDDGNEVDDEIDVDDENAQSEFAVKKPKPYRLKPKPQKLPQNRTAKKPQYAVLHFQKPQFAVLLSVLA